MKIIPLLRCNNLKETTSFYTNVLDFTLKYPDDADNEWVIELINNDAEILLASMDGTPRITIYVKVDNWMRYLKSTSAEDWLSQTTRIPRFIITQ